jgi:hypothetical protein
VMKPTPEVNEKKDIKSLTSGWKFWTILTSLLIFQYWGYINCVSSFPQTQWFKIITAYLVHSSIVSNLHEAQFGGSGFS